IRDFHVTGVQTCALPICCTLGYTTARLPGSYTRWRLFVVRGFSAIARSCTGGTMRAVCVLQNPVVAALSRSRPRMKKGETPGGRSEERRVGRETDDTRLR